MGHDLTRGCKQLWLVNTLFVQQAGDDRGRLVCRVNQVDAAVQAAMSPSTWKGGSVRLQPGSQLGRALEIQQGFRRRLQLLQR
jgi:hypothetical protein